MLIMSYTFNPEPVSSFYVDDSLTSGLITCNDISSTHGFLTCSNASYNSPTLHKNKIVLELNTPIKVYIVFQCVDSKLIKHEIEKLTNIPNTIIDMILQYHINISVTEQFDENDVYDNYYDMTSHTNTACIKATVNNTSFKIDNMCI